MPQILVIEKKTGCRRPIQRIIALDTEPSAARESIRPLIHQGSWTGQVQSGGGMYHARRKKK